MIRVAIIDAYGLGSIYEVDENSDWDEEDAEWVVENGTPVPNSDFDMILSEEW
jgi:hypothetical protein